MIRNLFLAALIAIGLASPAGAQTNDGGGPRPVVYSTHQLGDGSTPSGGTPPGQTSAPANVLTTASPSTYLYNSGVLPDTSAGKELKTRIICGMSHENDQDAQIAKGQASGPHRHTYAGNDSTDGNSTYTNSRLSSSSCPSNYFFNQSYWHPSICKNVDNTGGSNGSQWQCLKEDFLLVYYARGREVLGTLTKLPNDTFFITGRNTTKAFRDARAAEVPSGYTGGSQDGFIGYKCINNGVEAAVVGGGTTYPAFETPSGGDPWEGRCLAGAQMTVDQVAPECWNGFDRRAVDGRNHFRFKLTEIATGKKYCPDNWYEVPDAQFRPAWTIKKNAEYHVDKWFLSADCSPMAAMTGMPMSTTRPGCAIAGSLFHIDWGMTVDNDIWSTMMAKCLGIASPGYTAVGGDCGTNNVGDGRALVQYPATTQPRYTMKAKDRWWPVKAGLMTTRMIHGH